MWSGTIRDGKKFKSLCTAGVGRNKTNRKIFVDAPRRPWMLGPNPFAGSPRGRLETYGPAHDGSRFADGRFPAQGLGFAKDRPAGELRPGGVDAARGLVAPAVRA